MPNLGETLNELFSRAGLDQNDSTIIALLQNESVFKAQISQDIVDKMLAGLVNLETAKIKLYPTIKAEVLNGVDDHIFRVAKEIGFTDEEIAPLKAEANSGKKAELILKSQLDKTSKLLEEAKKGSGKGDNAALVEGLTKEVNELKTKITTLAQEKDNAVLEERKNSAAKEVNYLTLSAINEYIPRLDLPDSLTFAEKQSLAMSRLQKKAEEFKAKITVINNEIALVDENGTDVLDAQNKKVGFKVLAESAYSPILKKGGNSGAGNNGQQQNNQHQNKGGATDIQLSKIDAELQRQANLSN